MRAIIAALILTTTAPSPSQAAIVAQHAIAESLNSRELYDECRKPERYEFCLGFIMGTVSTIAHQRLEVNFHPFCLDMEQRPEPLVDIVVKYLEENPALRGGPATIHIAEALERAFPCEPPAVSADISQLSLTFPVRLENWLISDPEHPVFLFDDVPDRFPLQEDGASREGFFIEQDGLGLQGYKTYAARVQLVLKGGAVRTVDGQIRVVGERTSSETSIIPLMLAVGIEPVVHPRDVLVLTIDQIH